MYWSRTDSPLDIFLYLLLSGCWGLGGWLLVRFAFRLRRGEHLLSGLAAGFVLFISLSGLLALILPVPAAFWGGAGLVLFAGLIGAWCSPERPRFQLGDLRGWPLLIAALGVTIFYALALRGQAIFDEYLHIPLISTMAAGDIPPHFYLNPDLTFAYHYGIQIFAASLVRLGGLFPWSAWDISRALALGLTITLAWLFLRRMTGSPAGAGLGAFLLTFGGGARWMLRLLPSPWLAWVSQHVRLDGSGWDTAPSLAVALRRYWEFEGGGPLPLPFAFHNGIFVPVNFTLGSTAALPFVIVLLLLLLRPTGRFTWLGLAAWTLIFVALAHAAEHWFAFLWLGIAISLAVTGLRARKDRSGSPPGMRQWTLILLLSAGLALVQGGFITETARNLLTSILGLTAHSTNAYGFSLRWPPALPSAHLGSLTIIDPGQLIALLAELGPALLTLPLIVLVILRQQKRRRWLWSGLALSAFLSLLFPMFTRYGVDRSVTRFPATALWIGLLLAYSFLWRAIPRLNWQPRLGLGLGYICTVAGGIVILVTQVYSLPAELPTYFVQNLDAGFSRDYWNALPADAQVLDRIPERSVALFGRITRAHTGIYAPLPEWEASIADPDPYRLVQSGISYIYFDKEWWSQLDPDQRQRFEQPCVDVLDERQTADGLDYRVLMELGACTGP